jgi:SAM-dependent methyltransferase/uncharacterized protein YbaR (Trm112 family)
MAYGAADNVEPAAREEAIKPSILRSLVCPLCSATPQLEALETEGEEVLEGFFECRCGMQYPVIRGVPRLLPPQLLANLESVYPEFCTRYRERIRFLTAPGDVSSDSKVKSRTQAAFGYEWTWGADYDAATFANWLPTGFEAPTLFGNGVGLEVGCGAGRHSAYVASMAKEHVAVDLSQSVDVAFARTRSLSNCHIIQADVFQLPFRPRTFDYVFCLGVLQHLPDPERGFYALAEHPRAGGVLVANVYQASRPVMRLALEMSRKVTTRLPHGVLKYLSVGAACVDYGLFIGPWRSMSSTNIGRVLRRWVPDRIREYAKHDFHTCVIDWFDRWSCPVKKHYKREDLRRWYERAGYKDVVVTPDWQAFWNGYGVRLQEGEESLALVS